MLLIWQCFELKSLLKET